MLLLHAAPAQAATITVNTDDDDGGTGDCELRDAITAANANGGMVDGCTAGQAGPTVDTIAFNVGGGGQETIALTAPLPPIVDVVNINGTTQPGFAGAPLIEVDGSGLTTGSPNGFTFSQAFMTSNSSGSTLRGLTINGFSQGDTGGQFGVAIQATSTGNTVAGNYIGVEPNGVTDAGNGGPSSGGGIYAESSGNTIGGTTAASRNVIAGNVAGIVLFGNNADNNFVRGNYIGIGADGTTAVPQNFGGIALFPGAASNQIGGSAAGQGNVISNSGFYAVRISGAGSDDNTVQGNLIGTDAGGAGDHGNGDGVIVDFGALDNTIGGTAAGAGNVIANSNRDGVVIGGDQGSPGDHDTTDRNSILGNSIFNNGSTVFNLGIDIDDAQTGDGVTPNDLADVDSGPNQEQNFPVLTSAAPGTDVVSGTLNSGSSLTYRLEFFANAAADTSGFGEGRRFLGFANVTTDGAGNAAFSATVANFNPGEFITATATQMLTLTDPSHTSEFSQAVQAPLPTPVGGGGGLLSTPPSNLFSFGGLQRNAKKGIAFLTVMVPGPGTVSLGGNGIAAIARTRATASVQAPAAGPVRLKVKPVGKARRKLTQKGKVNVTAQVTFTPTGGSARTQASRVRLIKR